VYPHLPLLTLERLAACGVNGLGGAGFATAEKLIASGGPDRGVDTLLINAVECEPLISCDEALMMCEATAIVDAVEALMRMTRCRQCVIAIENDKHAAIAAMKTALAERSTQVELWLLAPVYPSGAERPLTALLMGHSLAAGMRPTDHVIVCVNVATALAAWDAQQGFPQTSRVVTVAGGACVKPVNVRVTFGTSVAEVLRQTGNGNNTGKLRVRVGGPLSGFDLHCLEGAVTATTNCIGIEPERVTADTSPCIRCGACSDVCPVALLPQQLYWYAQASDVTGAARFGLDNCIECGCCDVVCPSSIPLTQIFRYTRDMQRERQHQDSLAAIAEHRFQAREQRLAQRDAVRERQRREAKAKLSSGCDPIADALARARRRRKPGTGDDHRAGTGDGPA
jgi:electron transport complex protein RnfC